MAGRQHGVVSAGQLRRLGLSDEAIRARVGIGRLHRVHRGVYAVGHLALTPEGRWLAAVLAVGGGPAASGGGALDYWKAALSHRSAASLWDLLPVLDGPTDVLVAGNGGRSQRRGIRVHRSRSLHLSDVTLRRGIPVTTPTRTIADLRNSTAVGHRGALSARELRKTIRQADVAGLPIRESTPRDGTRSDLERNFLRLCRRHRLPPPEVNVRIDRYLVDFLWRGSKLVVETDSYLYHRGRTAFQDDRGRDLDLRRLGYEVLRVSERQLEEEQRRVVEAVIASLQDERSG